MQDLREAFKIFDKNKSGYIEVSEIVSVTATLGQALTEDELDEFMKEADANGDGKLDYEEFSRMMTREF